MKKVFLLSTISLFLVCNLCLARTIIVDKYGNGDCKTIQEAIINDGDIIKILPGIYEENLTINKAISLIGSGPNMTRILGVSLTDSTVNTTGSGPISIQNLKISGKYGIYIASYKTVIKNCIITNCSTGIYSKYTNVGIQSTIINNTIVFNDNGISLTLRSNSNVLIHGNIVAFNAEKGIYLNGFDQFSINYNNLYQNSTDYMGCPKGISDISEDPKFMDSNTGNFSLKFESPCINTGILGEYIDPDGTRNDIGAYAGPDSATFWPYVVGGPIVTEIEINPSSVPKGDPITVKAKGRIR